ncbi:MAG: alpha/beta hydrolase fold domain-containing protein [Elainellaceae cyanobacterium]
MKALEADLAEAFGAGVLTLGYRLAPEHPYPAALKDTLAAYRWLVGDRRAWSFPELPLASSKGPRAVCSLPRYPSTMKLLR